ncbi:MAG: pitrilysin family protein [Acidobacteriia bacterium]|nr:pitrilysin family protein [Terriglobia bacterium]
MKPGIKTFSVMCLAAVLLVIWSGAQYADAPKIQLPKYTRAVLPNGMIVLLMERHELPLVNFRWVLKSGGSIGDPAGKEGVAALTAGLLRKGTTGRTADQIASALDFVGATYEANAALEFSAGSAELLKKDAPLGVEMIADMLMHPVFPQDEVVKLREQSIDAIKEAKSVPGQIIQNYFAGALYGSTLYGRPVGGTEKSLATISRDDVVRFYQTHYAPNQLMLVAVGDFAAPEMERLVRGKFGTWEKIDVTSPAVSDQTSAQGHHFLLVEKPDSTQTFFRIGNVGLARTSADWIPLDVVNTLFGGRFTSLINSALRIKSGLTYGADSFFSSRRARGAFTIASYTPNETTEKAIEMTLDVLKQFRQQGITEEQLQSAKAYIKGQFGLSIETNDELAETVSSMEFYGLPSDYIDTYFDKIDALTLARANEMVQKYYPSENLVFVLIGKRDVIEPVAKKLGGETKIKSIVDEGF